MIPKGKLNCDFFSRVNNQHAIIMVGQTELHTLSIGENYCTFSLLSRFYFWKGNWDIPNKKILFAYVSLFLFIVPCSAKLCNFANVYRSFCVQPKKQKKRFLLQSNRMLGNSNSINDMPFDAKKYHHDLLWHIIKSQAAQCVRKFTRKWVASHTHNTRPIFWCTVVRFRCWKFHKIKYKTGWPKSKFPISNGYNSEMNPFWPHVGKA